MKNKSILIIAFIATSMFSIVQATPIKHSPAGNNSKTDTLLSKSDLPSFTVQIVGDNNNQKFILLVTNPLKEKLHIAIKFQSGEGYNETTSRTMLRKRFDMTGAEDGSYTVTVENGKTSIVKKVQVSTTTQVIRNIAF